jgi:hypothetical protein
MSYKIRRELFKLVSTLDIPKEEKNEYLKYLFEQNPLINHYYREHRGLIISFDKTIKLKSFFQGNEGVKFLHRENGCFEKEILPNLPEEYTPRKNLSASKFDIAGRSIIVPNIPFNVSYDQLILTESFSLYEMLSVFAAGIKEVEKNFLIKERPDWLLDVLLPEEPVLNIEGAKTFCSPKENDKPIPEFSVFYDREQKAWGINYYNGSD